jgi:hypothetical protein
MELLPEYEENPFEKVPVFFGPRKVMGQEFKVWIDVPDAELISILSRFKIEDPNDCWIWQGYIMNAGYGQVRFMGGLELTHRAMFMIFRGPISDKINLHHRCRNRACGNPEHLDPMLPGDHTAHEAFLRVDEKPMWCPYGHPYDEVNTYVRRGIRSCRTCHNTNSAIYYEKKKMAQRSLEAAGVIPRIVHNALKEYCPQGHKYEGNTYVVNKPGRNPSRVCKTCQDARGRAAYYRKVGKLDLALEQEKIYKRQPKVETEAVQ